MKKILIVIFNFFFLFSFSQTNNDIIGEWYNAEKDAVITIFEDNGTLSGKTTWMLEPNDENGQPKKDLLNPDENLRDRDRLGLVLMTGFAYIEGNVWDNGRLYNPKNGKIYGGKVAGPIFKELADKVFAMDMDIHKPISISDTCINLPQIKKEQAINQS